MSLTDYGCPTCGSNNFGNVEMIKRDNSIMMWKKQCYNCKKFWYSEFWLLK